MPTCWPITTRGRRRLAGRARAGRGQGAAGPRLGRRAGNFFGSTLVELRPGDPPAPTLSLAAGLALIEAVDVAVPGAGADAQMAQRPDAARRASSPASCSSGAATGSSSASASTWRRRRDLADRKTASLGAQIAPQAFAPLLAAASRACWTCGERASPGLLAHAWLARAHSARNASSPCTRGRMRRSPAASPASSRTARCGLRSTAGQSRSSAPETSRSTDRGHFPVIGKLLRARHRRERVRSVRRILYCPPSVAAETSAPVPPAGIPSPGRASPCHSFRPETAPRSSTRTGARRTRSRSSSITAGRSARDDWDNQMMFFLQQGFRVIAHDRRGHGRSSQTDGGNEMDTYAADVADAGHSARPSRTRSMSAIRPAAAKSPIMSREREPGRVAKAVLIDAVPPVMVKTDTNPGGTADRGVRRLSRGARRQPRPVLPRCRRPGPFYGFNRPGAQVSARA